LDISSLVDAFSVGSFAVGGVGDVAEASKATFRMTNGKGQLDFHIYSSGWSKGNQYIKPSQITKVSALGKAINGVGYGLGFLGILSSGFQFLQAKTEDEKIKYGVDAAVGLFGLTRKTLQKVDSTMVWVKRRHDGIDLKADPGTPVYSLYNGVIVRAYSDAPNHYSRGFGNELRIRCVNKSGDVFVVQYAHLNYGTPFAINPRTGNTFTVNDQVFQGDLIGYTGKTGNAFKDSDVPVKHLHLGIKSNGEWVDPKNYINGTIDTTKFFNGIIGNIKCD